MSTGGEPDENNSAQATDEPVKAQTESGSEAAKTKTVNETNNEASTDAAAGNSDSAAPAASESDSLTKESVVASLNTDRGIPTKLAGLLAELVISPTQIFTVNDFDDRAVAAVKDLDVEFLRTVIDELLAKDFANITNKSACLCGVVKQLKLKRQQQLGDSAAAAGGGAADRRGSSNYSVASSGAPSTLVASAAAPSSSASASGAAAAFVKPGPDETKLKELLAEIGFHHEVTVGQRRLGPPTGADEMKNTAQCEIFVGKLPKDMYEDQIYKMFRPVGPIYDVRVMVDPPTGMGRGFCFVCYMDGRDATEAVKKFHEYEIKPQRRLQVNLATPNLRLFVGNIPKTLDRVKLLEDFSRILDGVVDVIVYGSADDPRKKNRGFCFLEFDKHSSASAARRKLMKYPRVWSSDVWVDWADPLDEPDPETMAKVRVLYVKSLTMDVTEDRLQEAFSVHGPLERVKKVKDYGFVHFEEREDALRAMEKLNDTSIGKSGPLSVTLAKPVSERAKQRKEERRMRNSAMPVMAPPPAAAAFQQHPQAAYHQPGFYHHHSQHHPGYQGIPPGAPWAPGGGYGPNADPHPQHHQQHHHQQQQQHQPHHQAYAPAGGPGDPGASTWGVPGDQQQQHLYYQQQHLPPMHYQPYPPGQQPHHQLTSPPLPQQPSAQPHQMMQQGSIAAPSGRGQRGGGAMGGRPHYQQYQSQPVQQQQQQQLFASGRGHRGGGSGVGRPPIVGSMGRNGGRGGGSSPRPQQQQQQPPPYHHS